MLRTAQAKITHSLFHRHSFHSKGFEWQLSCAWVTLCMRHFGFLPRHVLIHCWRSREYRKKQLTAAPTIKAFSKVFKAPECPFGGCRRPNIKPHLMFPLKPHQCCAVLLPVTDKVQHLNDFWWLPANEARLESTGRIPFPSSIITNWEVSAPLFEIHTTASCVTHDAFTANQPGGWTDSGQTFSLGTKTKVTESEQTLGDSVSQMTQTPDSPLVSDSYKFKSVKNKEKENSFPALVLTQSVQQLGFRKFKFC